MSENMLSCRICANKEGNKLHSASEKMFALGGHFVYLECGCCGCLQLTNPPDDFGPYYPTNYYSYRLTVALGFKAKLERLMKVWRAGIVLQPASLLRKWLLRRYPNAGISALLPLKLQKTDRILDVGCGNGALLFDLSENGFKSLLGVDPFVEKELSYPNGVKVQKQTLEDTAGTFDLIMMHHAFEHMNEPLLVLQAARARLAVTGTLLIRIPVAKSAVWETYGTNWVQLDAPRHLYLHTEESLRHLAQKAGLRLKMVIYDGTAFQFWGSEMYQAGRPLLHNPTMPAAPDPDLFSVLQLREFESRAVAFNAKQRADQAAFYFEVDHHEQ